MEKNVKCRCECKQLIDKGICKKGFIWNPSNCECECDKPCDVGEYFDYNRRKRLIDKLVEECCKNIHGNDLIYNRNLNYYEKVCNSCTVYTVFIVLFFIASKYRT